MFCHTQDHVPLGASSALLSCLLQLPLISYYEGTCALKKEQSLRKTNKTLPLLAKSLSIKSLPFLDFIDWLPLIGLDMF